MLGTETENTAKHHLAEYAWKPGVSGNPAGKPKGSRNKLGEAFIEALNNDFAEHGVAVIAAVRADKPADYLKVIASLMPKQLELKETTFDGLTAADLATLIHSAASALGLAESSEGGIIIEGTSEQTGELQAVQETG